MERVKNMSLGEFIAKRRKHLRLTQEQLAEQIHVSKSAVAKWETNGGVPDRGNLKKLAEVLFISLDDLYRIIESRHVDQVSLDVNITADVVAVLRSYGYTVIPPNFDVEDL